MEEKGRGGERGGGGRGGEFFMWVTHMCTSLSKIRAKRKWDILINTENIW
jgi:GTPase involved in cell partitioning and DNA repair